MSALVCNVLRRMSDTVNCGESDLHSHREMGARALQAGLAVGHRERVIPYSLAGVAGFLGKRKAPGIQGLSFTWSSETHAVQDCAVVCRESSI